MENSLLGSLFIKKTAYSKQLIYENQLVRTSFSKTTYTKQLIYGKQLIRISFYKKNNLFETAYLGKTVY